jgi:hypothetical protein
MVAYILWREGEDKSMEEKQDYEFRNYLQTGT